MKIAICDYEKLCRSQPEDIAADYAQERTDTDISFHSFPGPESLLTTVQSGISFDIYILDIVMPGMDGIRVDLGLAFPDTLPVNEAELATAIANTLENALNACQPLDPHKRWIELKVLDRPRFMIRVSNGFDGKVEFDQDDIPVNHDEEHGFGTRFIAAFCEKNNGFYRFQADGERFSLYLNF